MEEVKEGFFFFLAVSLSSSRTSLGGLARRRPGRSKRFLFLYHFFVLSLASSSVSYPRRKETSGLFAEGYEFAGSRSDLSSFRRISRHQTHAFASSTPSSSSSSSLFSVQTPVYSTLEVAEAPGEGEREEEAEETRTEEQARHSPVPPELDIHTPVDSRSGGLLDPELSLGQRAPHPPSSLASSGSSPSSSPLGRPPRFPSSWKDWMTAQDKEGKSQLSRQCQDVKDFDARNWAEPALIRLLDEKVPEGSLMTVRVLSSDQEEPQEPPPPSREASYAPPSAAVVGGPSTASAAARGAGGKGGEEEGERRRYSRVSGGGEEGSLLTFRRGRVLGTGGEAVVVEGQLVKPSDPDLGRRSSMPNTRAPSFRRSRSLRVTRREREEHLFSSSASSAPFPSPLSSLLRGARNRTMLPTVAIRFLVSSRRLKFLPPSSPSSAPQPSPYPLVPHRSPSSEAIARYVEEMHAEQERLVNLSRRFGGSDLLKNTYGFVLPAFTGRLHRFRRVLNQLHRRRGKTGDNRFLLNQLTISPSLRTDLGALLSNPNLGVPALIYVAKSLIKLAANLELFGLVHRDIKPENLLVDEAGNVFLSDFQFVKERNQMLSCREIVSTVLVEPGLALCSLKFPEFRLRAEPPYDAWMTGMTVFKWLCNDYPFRGMITYPWQLDSTILAGRPALTGRQILWHNVATVAKLYDKAVVLPERRNKKFLAPIDWSRCLRFPHIANYPLLQDAIQGLLDINPSTRLRPSEMVSTHPLFTAAEA